MGCFSLSPVYLLYMDYSKLPLTILSLTLGQA